MHGGAIHVLKGDKGKSASCIVKFMVAYVNLFTRLPKRYHLVYLFQTQLEGELFQKYVIDDCVVIGAVTFLSIC